MRIVLFMTYGVALEDWHKQKILERELSLYIRYRESGNSLVIVSYGRQQDTLLGVQHGVSEVLINSWRLPSRLYSWLIPILHRRSLKNSDLFKTNQMKGAHVARRCANLFNKPLIVRQGYSYYEFIKKESRMVGIRSFLAKRYEAKHLLAANAIICTTQELATRLSKRYDISNDVVSVIPNYVIAEIWSPPYQPRLFGEIGVIGFVGRFARQKNLFTLIEAVAGLSVKVILIGSGPDERRLQASARAHGVSLEMPGQMNQPDLVEALRACDCFVLPSLYEGHPKALIEAMMFGIPVLGTACPGIREEIDNGVTGLLSSTTVEGLRDGIKKMFNLSVAERARMGSAARQSAQKRYGLDDIARMELDLLETVQRQLRVRN